MRTGLWTQTIVAISLLAFPAVPASAVAAPPTIDAESVSGVTETSAVLEAAIDPQSSERGARYQFQLAREASEFAPRFACPPEWEGSSLCLTLVYEEGGALPLGLTGEGTEDQDVGLDLASAGVTLQPDTAYSYRVIAAGSVLTIDTIAWEEPIVLGPARTFATIAEEPEEGACVEPWPEVSGELEDGPGPGNVTPKTGPTQHSHPHRYPPRCRRSHRGTQAGHGTHRHHHHRHRRGIRRACAVAGPA